MASPRCPSCTDVGTKSCSGCKAIKYCSEECQQADWPTHKVFCKLFQQLPERPSPSHLLFVFFPKDGTKPELRWSDIRPMDLEEFTDGHCLYPKEIRHNMITGAEMEKSVFFHFDDDFKRNYQEPNKAVDSVTAKKSTFRWRGPVLAVCGPDNWNPLYEDLLDVDALACSDLAAFLITYCNMTPEQQRRVNRRGPKTQAVKATCPGEQALSGAAPYVPVQIPAMHPIFENSMTETEIAAISDGINMPLAFWRYPENKNWPNVDKRACNQKVCHMHKGIDPEVQDPDDAFSGCFGYSSHYWDFNPGNVLIVRGDRKPITPEEVEAFGDFCFFHLTQYFQLRSERTGDVTDARMKEIEAMIVGEASPGKWQTYLQDWRKVKAGVTGDPEVEGRVDGKVRMGLTDEDGKKLCFHLLCTHRA